jgi:formylglycine-generating enzyme required for sulfatase activity
VDPAADPAFAAAAAARRRASPLAEGFGPDWASAWGVDTFGVYAEVDIAGVVQRFRYIEPGVFSMGSPESEPVRFDSETQHEVELTAGYWLGETACSQALWEAVMGENPSHFRGPLLPVETVSHDDAMEFVRRVEAERPELGLRLPTEAEWEYTCRAGTQTPFSFGPNTTTDDVNYNGNSPYAGAPKGEYREKTVPVGSLPPNAWGLREMHGNVWEWCSDWSGPYEPGRTVNPEGPARGEDRVLRGGSWFDDALLARSAFRDALVPGYRSVVIGFRLARGHEQQD